MSLPLLTSSAAIENTYRMACALDAKREELEALSRFYLIIDSLERLIMRNSTANIDIRYAILSLGNIADIYERRHDTKKTLAFRESQLAFLQHLKQSQSTPDDDEETPAVVEIVSVASAYSRLFRKVQEARDLPEKANETPDEIIRRYKEAVAKEEEQKVERFVQLLEQTTAARKAEIENSFWRKNLQRMVDHPFVFLLVILGIGLVLILAFRLRPKTRIVIPEGMDERMEFIDRMLQQTPQRPARAKKASAPAPTKPRTPQRAKSKEPEPVIDHTLFDI
jgi:hypothetical protein